MSQALVIHINGWPGVGKLTVARPLARLVGARLIDNHTMINPAEALFSRRDPLYASLRGELRKSILGHVRQADPATSFVFTDALSDDAHDTAMFDEIADVAKHRDARLVAVVLECEEGKNTKRLTASGREDLHKLTNPEALLRLRSTYRLLRATASPIELDITHFKPDEAAAEIARRIR